MIYHNFIQFEDGYNLFNVYQFFIIIIEVLCHLHNIVTYPIMKVDASTLTANKLDH